jgi:hypothetical protein
MVRIEYTPITLNFSVFGADINVDRHKTPTCEGHMLGLSSRMNDFEGSE